MTEIKVGGKDTGTKPGWKTSEMWLSIATVIGGFLLASGAFPTDSEVVKGLGAVVSALVAAGYGWNRTKIKKR